MNKPMPQIIIPKWKMEIDQTYVYTNKQEVDSCNLAKQKNK